MAQTRSGGCSIGRLLGEDLMGRENAAGAKPLQHFQSAEIAPAYMLGESAAKSVTAIGSTTRL
jgi:hypothetical protein